ncbi:tetratricopeptide repeat protein 29 [Anoplopoma fimbria]|uniref:tetratricopeptide repeat protein 29 n=1 Tax=Anoplopoma fimbria TaxID=229290 RepID=UPI0023EC361B|nr:tetratricopeptide repeat protein 29 [Anoplopoma fimbria]
MNAALARRHVEPSLLETTNNSNQRRKHSQYRFRNSLKQNICVELLQEGYHRSFSELFSLLSSDLDRRAAGEPGSPLRLQTPLEEQWDKLDTMRRHLRRAEQAEKTCSWTVVCDQRLFLGRYFSSPEDFWLSLHFYQSCAEREHGGRSRPATEARVCMAEVYLQQGELQQARQQAELCIQQAEGVDWLDSSDRPLRLRALGALWRIYSRLADAPLDAGDYEEALRLLHEGHSIAAETEDKHIQSESCYQLGLTNQRAGDHDTAKQFFNSCMQICGTLQDADGLGKSYKAMARSMDEGNTQDTLQCLEKLADISRSNGLQRNLVDALLSLGNIYYTMSQYTRACEYFLQACEVSCKLEDVSLLQKAQVKF